MTYAKKTSVDVAMRGVDYVFAAVALKHAFSYYIISSIWRRVTMFPRTSFAEGLTRTVRWYLARLVK